MKKFWSERALTICLFFRAISCRSDTTTIPGSQNAATTASASPPPSLSSASPSSSISPAPSASIASADYANATIKSAKAIGHTSVVFKTTFTDGRVAAFKPESHRGPVRYRAEAAAYRLSKALAIENVPPAFLLTLGADDLNHALTDEKSRALYDAEVVIHEGRVRGALIPWIQDLSFVELENEPLRTTWKAWLKAGATQSGPYSENASEISAMCIFDALTGNWDRWSGANIGLDRSKKHLLFIDNDGAFYDPVPQGPYQKQLAILKDADRFPRAVIAAARTLDAASLDLALGKDETGAPLLNASQRAALLKRRDDVMKIVDTKVSTLGEAVVLSF